jgi:hypothetical protein
MAWRMGDWQEAAELQAPLPDAGDSAPFHQAICTSLKVPTMLFLDLPHD